MIEESVSICQADLGLAEPPPPSETSLPSIQFQSARQIWVWPNMRRTWHAASSILVSICQADLGLAELDTLRALTTQAQCFNLPGRFGFGRTKHYIMEGVASDQFQSARQIWVWPNTNVAHAFDVEVGFQSARQIWVWPNLKAGGTFNRVALFQSARQI